MMNMDNCCIQWAAFKLWRSIAAGADAAEAIAAAGVLFDNFLFRMEVSRGKKRLCPAEEFVALCRGDIAIATELATLHRDYVVAALALNVAARGGVEANVVSFGDVAEAYVAKQLVPTGLVDVAGRFPHPEALLSIKGDIQEKIKNGKIFNAPTKREIYVAADSAAAAIARICGFRVVVTYHVDLYEGHGDLLGELAKLRSKRMEDVWASLSDDEYAAWCANIADGWAKLSPEERTARAGWAVSAEEYAARCKANRANSANSRFSIGNTHNTRPDTPHLWCPNPACCGGAHDGPYRASFSQKKRDFTNHFAACSPCANFVRKTIDAKDPHGVLWGWKPGNKSKWPKWLPPKKPKK